MALHLRPPLRVSLALLAAAGLLSCGESSSPEDELRTLVAEGVRAAEEGDLDALVELVAEDYADDRGNDRRALRLTVGYYLRSYGTLHLLHRVTGVEIEAEGESRIAFAVAMAARPIGGAGDLAELEADLMRVELRAARREGDWKVVWARWEPGSPGDFL
jgi:hypothetical protein